MSDIAITLPDGSERTLPEGATGTDLAASIGKRLAKDAVVVEVNGEPTDLAAPLHDGDAVRIVTVKDDEALEHLRHSTAHVLAQAVLKLWPGATFAGGPAIADGFYYDFELPGGAAFTEADLERIEARMREIVAAERSVRMGEYADMFEGLASIAGAGGKKMLKAQATLSAVATLISGYEAAMKAAAEAVTIPGRIAAYAKFLGMGLSAVAQIRKAGGIGGATGAVTPAAPAMQQASPVNVSIQGINPASLYTGQQMIDLTTAVQKELKNRGVLFSYI